MPRIRAVLTLYAGEGKRQRPFFHGYRPLFAVEAGQLVSGMVGLEGRSEVGPGETTTVEIRFLRDHAFRVGMRLMFFEAVEPLGEIEVVEVLKDAPDGVLPPDP